MKTLMIAHRGFSKYERENTVAAFIAAGATPEFYGIETDVHVTTDGHYVIIHDETTNRVCNDKTCIDVEKSTFVEVSRVVIPDLDATGTSLRRDLVIPELIDYIKICKKYNKVGVLELKQLFTKKQIEEILSIIENEGMLDNMVIISFYLEDLILVRKLNKKIKAQWLLCKYEEKHLETLIKYNLGLDVNYPTIDKEGIDLCHKNNVEVNVWTVDSLEIAQKYAAWGVDYITSNALKSIE